MKREPILSISDVMTEVRRAKHQRAVRFHTETLKRRVRHLAVKACPPKAPPMFSPGTPSHAFALRLCLSLVVATFVGLAYLLHTSLGS